MGPPTRKRVARAASGAFSLYLPKRWIDSWPEAQQASREVELHEVGDLLVLQPASGPCALDLPAPPGTDAARTLVASAFVRGHRDVCLRGEAALPADTFAALREGVRRLGGGIQQGPDGLRMAFPDTAEDADRLLRAIGAHARAMVDLLGEASASDGADPARAVHAIRLLQRIQEDDLGPAFHRLLRGAATFRLGLPTLTDVQRAVLMGAGLNVIAQECIAGAALLLADLGLTREDLAYPHEHLAPRLKAAPPPDLAREFVQRHTECLREAGGMLSELVASDLRGDPARLARLAAACAEARTAAHRSLYEAVASRWGEPGVPPQRERIFRAFQLHTTGTNLMRAVEELAALGAMFHAAGVPGPGAAPAASTQA